MLLVLYLSARLSLEAGGPHGQFANDRRYVLRRIGWGGGNAIPGLTHGCFAGIGLPACDASVAVYEVKGVINQTAQPFGITALQLHDVLQTAFDGVTRSCWGKLYKSDGTDHAYRYQLRLANGTLVTAVAYAGGNGASR